MSSIPCLRFLRLLQVTMSPPSHISSTLLLLTTALQVNTSTKPSESYSTTGQHVPISSHISHSLLLPTTGLRVNRSSKPPESYQYYRSTCPHLAIYLILHYYLLQVYRLTCRQNTKNHTLLQFTMSPSHHIYYTLLLSTTSLQVNTSSKPSKPYLYYRPPCNVPTSSYLLFSTTTYYRSIGQHVVKTLKTIPVLQVNMSLPRHISYSLLLPTTGLQVNTS